MRRLFAIEFRLVIVYVVALSGLMALVGTSPAVAAAPGALSLFPPSVERGQSVKVAVGEIKPWPVTVWTDAAGLVVTPAEKSGQVTVTASGDVEPGVHWLRFMNADGAGPPQPFVVGTLPEVLEREPNNTLAKSQTLPSTQVVVIGKLAAAGDFDTFAVPLQAGEQVVLDLQAHRPFASPMDGVLQLVDAQGFVVAQDHDFVGLDPRITFTALTAGTYHVRLFAFPEVATSAVGLGGGDKFVYRLTVSTAGYVDYAWPGVIGRQGPQRVQLCGANIPPALQKLTIEDPTARDVFRVFHKQLAGGATVRVVDRPVVLEQEPNDRAHAQAITLPVTIVGRCQAPGDEDVFRFEGLKDKKLVVKVESRSLGFVMDPFLTLFDADGKVLKSLDDAKDDRDCELSEVTRTPAPYRLAIRDLYGKGSERFVYCLTMQYEPPGFELTFAATEYTVAIKKPLEIAVGIDRQGSYAQPITLEVQGLPEWIKVEAPPALVKGDTAKSVKIKLTAEKPWSGPIEIVGRGPVSKDAPAPLITRAASTTLPQTGERWQQIWLTVTK